jgi:hypothetical protein
VRRFSFVLMVLALRPAQANADPNPIPAGQGWFCYEAHAEYNPQDRSGRCFRSEEDCNAGRGTYDRNPSSVVSECRPQKNAAVVTYYDVMRELEVAWPVPSSELCTETRAYLLHSKDNQRVSACRLVGDLEPPPGPFRSDMAPPGSTWYCTHAPGYLSLCSRVAATCAEAAKALGDGAARSCTQQKNVAALTWGDNEVSDLGFAAATNMRAHNFGAFGSSADCERWRKRWAPIWQDGLSLCRRVGDVEYPPQDRSQFPEGNEWQCLPDSVTPAVKGQDTCFRRSRDCQDAVRNGVGESDETTCRTTASAYLFTTANAFFAFRTAAECKATQELRDDSSRCGAVGNIAGKADGAGPAGGVGYCFSGVSDQGLPRRFCSIDEDDCKRLLDAQHVTAKCNRVANLPCTPGDGDPWCDVPR